MQKRGAQTNPPKELDTQERKQREAQDILQLTVF